MTARCIPGPSNAFDVDVYDCQCGHAYGDHEYEWSEVGGAAREMIIARCTKCDSTTQAADVAREAERAAVVAWLRDDWRWSESAPSGTHAVRSRPPSDRRTLADAIERGEHTR